MTARIATEQEMIERVRKQEDCLNFMRRGLMVIHDKMLLMELEVVAGLSPKIDVEQYGNKLKTALMKRTEELYDVETISPVFTKARINLTEYGLAENGHK